jgi:MoaA/NifB/PqqE/SkfB family radical SAM enzyme
LQGDTYRIMKTVAKVNPGCLWNITTNATWKLNDFVREHLDPLKFRQIIISADSLIPEVFARLRPPAKLSRFTSTVEALSRYDYERIREGKSGLGLATNSTIQRDNWREVPELVKFGEELGNISPNLAILYRPEELSILSEDLETREGMLRYLFDRVEPAYLPRAGRVIRPLLESVSPLFRASLLDSVAAP